MVGPVTGYTLTLKVLYHGCSYSIRIIVIMRVLPLTSSTQYFAHLELEHSYGT